MKVICYTLLHVTFRSVVNMYCEAGRRVMLIETDFQVGHSYVSDLSLKWDSYLIIFIVIMMKLPLKRWLSALCTFLIGEVIPRVSPACCSDCSWYVNAYRGDALKCADHNCLQLFFQKCNFRYF